MNKQMTPAEIELARQSFAKLAFGAEYNEGGSPTYCRSRVALLRLRQDRLSRANVG